MASDAGEPTAQWWLNPAIADLAFGSESPGATEPWQFDGRFDLDLADPEQRMLGEYELLELIGEGGMGLVYRARQTVLERDVAVKLLSAGPWASADFIDRFRAEAKHAAQLQHPGIVAVHEMGELNGLVFFAMQLVLGPSLVGHLRDQGGRLPEHQAAALMRVVAESVAYAHSLGVLHLDLKPGNILLGEGGEPQIVDFGLARQLGPGASLDNNQIAGTPSYMAPEQATAGVAALSRATDIWGLGAILYELVCGQPPFDAGDVQKTLQLVRDEPVPKPSQLTRVSPDLEAICLKCLEREPADRYPDARSLADDLGRFLQGRPVTVRPLSRWGEMLRWGRREPLLAITIGAAILALALGAFATSLQWLRAEQNAATANERLWESRREAALQLERDGKGWEALPRLIENVKEQEFRGETSAAEMDRLRIGLLLGQGAALIDAIAVGDINILAVALSPDGKLLAISGNDQSVRWYDTGTLTEQGRISLRGVLSSGGQPRSALLLRFVDSRRLRVTLEWFAGYANPTDSDTWLLDLQDASVVEPPAALAGSSDTIYSQDGNLALVRGQDQRVQLYAVSGWQALSEPVESPEPQWEAMPWLISSDNRHAALLGAGMRTIHLFALPALVYQKSVSLPEEVGVSAWTTRHAGGGFLIGDLQGRIFFIDPDAEGLRPFLAARGEAVSWLSFSEDDQWFASGSVDGTVQAFDFGQGKSLVSGSMRQDFAVRRVEVSRARRLLLASGDGQAGLWRISDSPQSPRPAIRLGTGPAMHGQAGPYAVDWSLASGLLASAGIDGQLRLWRLPRSTTLPAQTAPQGADSPRYYDDSLVDVAWNRVRIVNPDGAQTAWLELDEPPGFAELLNKSRSLVLTTGPELRVLDPATLRPRYPPIKLPNSPQRLLAAPDGRRLVLSFGAPSPDGFTDQLRVYDIETGRALPGEARVAGPSVSMHFSPDGERIVVVGPASGATTALATDGLAVIASRPQDAFQPVIDAAFAADSRTIWLAARADDTRLGADKLLSWFPVSGRPEAAYPAGQALPYGVLALKDGAFVVGESRHLILREQQLQTIPRLKMATHTMAGAFAASPEGRLIAIGSMHAVQILSADGALLGRPIPVDAVAHDAIGGLAFSESGDALVARTNWRWAHLPIRPEKRSVATLERLVARVSVNSESAQSLLVPSAEDRSLLRRSDPGSWPTLEPRPEPTPAALTPDGGTVPRRTANATPLMLDLSEHYAVGPFSGRHSASAIRPYLRPFPAGVHRLGNVDFDIRGMLEVELGGRGVGCVEVPDVPVAAVHALMLPVVRSPAAEPQLLAEVILRYRDDGTTALPVRSGIEVPGYAGRDQRVPFVFGDKILRGVGFRGQTLSAPRFANPEPTRAVRCVEIRTLGNPLTVFAMTVEAAP